LGRCDHEKKFCEVGAQIETSSDAGALKDIQAVDGKVNVLLGTGIARISAVMKELYRQKFGGLVAVEYEKRAT
jgi:hypothetical protein